MSFAALALVLGHAAIFGIVHEADEGTAAHIFQLLMVGQVPFVASAFAVRGRPSRIPYPDPHNGLLPTRVHRILTYYIGHILYQEQSRRCLQLLAVSGTRGQTP